MTDNNLPLVAGETAYTVTHDQPGFSPREREGDPYLFRDQAFAQGIADTFNRLGTPWPYRVTEIIVKPGIDIYGRERVEPGTPVSDSGWEG